MRVESISSKTIQNKLDGRFEKINQKPEYQEKMYWYCKSPIMGLVSFGSKQSSINDLLTGAKKVCKTIKEIFVLEWERNTTKPNQNRLKEIADSMSKLEILKQKQTKSPIIKTSIANLKKENTNNLEDFDKGLLNYWGKALAQAQNVPSDLVETKSKLTNYANNAWVEARESNDFKKFEPYLTDIVTVTKKEAKYINPEKNPLDTLLDYSGYTANDITKIFSDLRKDLVPLAKQIIAKSNVNMELLNKPTNPKQWQDFALEVAKDIGLDMSKIKLGNSPHSFMMNFDSPKELGISITQREPNVKDCIKLLMSFIHESGHALFEQKASKKLYRTGLAGGTLDLHESQSRLWENMVGRSKEFWQHYFPKLQEKVDGFKDVKFDDFYNALNIVECSPIRIKADEVTYNLHIALRHEIENELLNPKNTDEDIKNLVNKLPETWNNKMEEYLGIKPKSEKEGVLQDIHWSIGSLGYFPSYGLGNLMAAQIMNTAKKEIPDLNQRIASGNLKTLSDWLTEKIYKNGQIYTSAEVMQRVTGESLNPKYFIEYLKSKYL